MTQYIIENGEISDSYHTFSELYAHRHQLFIALCNTNLGLFESWKSEYHSDGSPAYEYYFIAGLYLDKETQITYHLPIELWDLLKCKTLDKAPEWDGHTSKEVITRLLNFNKNLI